MTRRAEMILNSPKTLNSVKTMMELLNLNDDLFSSQQMEFQPELDSSYELQTGLPLATSESPPETLVADLPSSQTGASAIPVSQGSVEPPVEATPEAVPAAAEEELLQNRCG